MKILLVSPLPPPDGGIATWTRLYINSEIALQNNIKIINTAVKGKRVNNLAKRSLVEELKRSINLYNEINSCLHNDKFDVVHFNSSCSRLGMIRDYIYAIKVKNKNAKLIIHLHCDTQYMVRGRIAEFFFKKLCKLSDKILCLNKTSQIHIKTVTGKESVVTPNFFKMSDLETISKRAVSERIENIIFIGNIIKAKGCVDIISAARQLPDITFKLAGYLSDEIKNLPIPKNIQYLGQVSKLEVLNRMVESDLLLFPTYSEGFPNVVLEAMACGLPIISTPVGAIPDMIEDNGGILVGVGDENGIVKAINTLQSKELRENMSMWNREKVSKVYSVDVVMEQIFNEYNTIM